MYYYVDIYYEQDSEGQLQNDSRKIISTHFEWRLSCYTFELLIL